MRGAASYTVGTNNKVIFTLTDSLDDNGSGWIGGIADASASLSSYIGNSGNSLGIQSSSFSSGPDYASNVTLAGGATACGAALNIVQGSVLWIAVDFNNGHLSCGTSCSAWANSGNPDAGNGFTYTLTAATTFYPAFSGFAWSGSTVDADKAQLTTKPNLSGCSTNATTFSQWG